MTHAPQSQPNRDDMIRQALTALRHGRSKEAVLRHLIQKGCSQEMARQILSQAEHDRRAAIRRVGIRNVLIGSAWFAVGLIYLAQGHNPNTSLRASFLTACFLGGGSLILWGLSQIFMGI